MKAWVEDYIGAHQRVVGSIPAGKVAELIEWVDGLRRASRTLFVCGNGGSAANASHFAVDLGKSASVGRDPRFRVVSLNDNTPYLTAIGNDLGYENLFVEQLANLAGPGDGLLCMSVSGNSPNVVRALEWANEHEVVTVGLGSRRQGRLAELAKHTVLIDDEHFGRVEDAHMHICHMMCYAFVENA